jgi:hypothetical protein
MPHRHGGDGSASPLHRPLLKLIQAALAAFPRFAANSHAIYGVDGSLETQKGRFNVLPPADQESKDVIVN